MLRFIEKPDPAHVTTNTINAGIYLLERALLARIPEGRPSSIEREFFPGLLADRIPFYGWVGEHYWLDIGNPAKYRQAQLDLMDGRVSTSLRVIQDADRRSDRRRCRGRLDGDRHGPLRHRRREPARRGKPRRARRPCWASGAWSGRDARLTGAILWDRVSVGDGAVLERLHHRRGSADRPRAHASGPAWWSRPIASWQPTNASMPDARQGLGRPGVLLYRG